ncbi:efflux transporter outer membrane subunit [Noviherbaspirillum cavernae]|nr:efflux transporter outer membrane subunit [Noviherbaspirillum cavernae]
MSSFVTKCMRRTACSLPTTAVAVLLAGCASFQGIVPAAIPSAPVALSTPGGLDRTQDAWPREDWWSVYGDPQLDALIRHAIENSPSLATARTRIARAQAAVSLNQAATAPQLNATAEATYGRQSENHMVPRPPLGTGGEWVSQGLAALNFGYDLDFWGKNDALIRTAEAQVKAAGFDRDAAQLALATSIARAYVQLAAHFELQDVLLATQKQREAIRKLTTQRVANGLDTRVELKQNETNEAALRADLTQIAMQIDITRLQLAALAGDMPNAAQQIGRPALGSAPFFVPKNLQLDLLARRPELAAQRARIAAATGDADAAKAQFYPNISLNALAGFQSVGLDKLLSAGSLMSSFGPAIHLPVFDGGRLRANYAIKTADLDGAITQYNQSIVTAAQEVAEQLTRAASLSREEDAVRDALASAEEAHRLAMLRYRAGLSPYLTVLTVETQLLLQRRAAVDIKAKRHDVQVALVRTLGGGFNDAQPAHTSGKTQH